MTVQVHLMLYTLLVSSHCISPYHTLTYGTFCFDPLLLIQFFLMFFIIFLCFDFYFFFML